MVVFKIHKKFVPVYVADCKLWATAAKAWRGFLGYKTLFRTNQKDHYASFYMWKSEKNHAGFMKKNHERLVGMSKCPVEVIGYYNFVSKTTIS